MTRRERDILKASVSWTDKTLTVNEEKAFKAGAKWADKTMIEKVEQLLIKSGRGQMISSLHRFLEEE